MLQTYYLSIFFISVILAVAYVLIWHKHFNASIMGIFILIPLNNLGYLLLYDNPDVRSAYIGFKVIYLGGCLLPWFITMTVCDLCKIVVNRWIRTVAFIINCLMYGAILTMGHGNLFYRSLDIKISDPYIFMDKEYGPMHSVFYVMVCVYFLISIAVIFYSLFNKKQVSRIVLILLFIPEALTVVGYFFNHYLVGGFEILPITYLFAQITYIFIVRRMSLYDVGDMVMEALVQSGDTGFIIMDFSYNYLGSNETAKNILPALRDMTIDTNINNREMLKKTVYHWVEHFVEDPKNNKNLYVKRAEGGKGEDRMYSVNVDFLFDGEKRRGYQVFLADDTQNQKYIKLLDKYNTELEEEVEEKTKSLVLMHDNLVLSMATMVESRDNSTGGHIKRTSDGVRILVNEIKKDNRLNLSDEFCKDIIKAAPMHDLGKIAVDDAILRKPGRFTPEEFEEMKKHAGEGAKIVHEILKSTDDESFKIVAENVAHYHHERWDGSGYPEGLKGEEIPIEARIMAIADVYDALVSKRVYKDSMSFEEADRIILDGMGKHFDDNLRQYYLKARSRLEKYYREILKNGE
ncbi:MAG: HD domain-containing protein [Lachnospiraceae bacterium]|nr:HD domain-containing protein [Lachnospiraceae bacterium]